MNNEIKYLKGWTNQEIIDSIIALTDNRKILPKEVLTGIKEQAEELKKRLQPITITNGGNKMIRVQLIESMGVKEFKQNLDEFLYYVQKELQGKIINVQYCPIHPSDFWYSAMVTFEVNS